MVAFIWEANFTTNEEKAQSLGWKMHFILGQHIKKCTYIYIFK